MKKNTSTEITVNETIFLLSGLPWKVVERKAERVKIKRFDGKVEKWTEASNVEKRLSMGMNIENFPLVKRF